MRLITNSQMMRYYLYATIVSFCAAVAFTVPVIVPEFTFPLTLTIWPGTWMFQAYFAFLIVGVLGNLGWTALIDFMKRSTGKEYGRRYLGFTHLALSNIGVYGATGAMFAVGFFGGYGALVGYGRAVITQAIIGWMVVPIGVFIYLYILASLCGVANLVLMLRPDQAIASQAESPGMRSDLRFWGVFVALVSLIFVLLPVLEMPYYPNNTFQELSVMGISTVALLGGLGMLAYGGLSKESHVRTLAAKGEGAGSVGKP